MSAGREGVGDWNPALSLRGAGSKNSLMCLDLLSLFFGSHASLSGGVSAGRGGVGGWNPALSMRGAGSKNSLMCLDLLSLFFGSLASLSGGVSAGSRGVGGGSQMQSWGRVIGGGQAQLNPVIGRQRVTSPEGTQKKKMRVGDNLEERKGGVGNRERSSRLLSCLGLEISSTGKVISGVGDDSSQRPDRHGGGARVVSPAYGSGIPYSFYFPA